ncbi:TPA: hypothetical protein EYP66_11790 [Candidatus Poribacteria bacterium]|nr:hypothetical protein [Candidatus Poribacteria bacterium]
MATNPPKGDGHRNGAVRQRSQTKPVSCCRTCFAFHNSCGCCLIRDTSTLSSVNNSGAISPCSFTRTKKSRS